MTIVAGGDSFVWGSELPDSPHGGPNGYSRKTFTSLLAGDDSYVCTAYPGLGNRDIARRVRDYLVWAKTTDLAVIVCWTWPSRDGLLDSDQTILSLQDHLEHYRIPYLFTCVDNCIRTENPNIKWEEWFWFPPAAKEEIYGTHSPRGFYQWACENKYQVGPEHHPLVDAHHDAAELMRGKFNELVKKTL
jgi:hypothetical protein